MEKCRSGKAEMPAEARHKKTFIKLLRRKHPVHRAVVRFHGQVGDELLGKADAEGRSTEGRVGQQAVVVALAVAQTLRARVVRVAQMRGHAPEAAGANEAIGGVEP